MLCRTEPNSGPNLMNASQLWANAEPKVGRSKAKFGFTERELGEVSQIQPNLAQIGPKLVEPAGSRSNTTRIWSIPA